MSDLSNLPFVTHAAFPAALLDGDGLSIGRVRDVVPVPGPLGWGLSVSPNRRKFLVTRLTTGESDLRFIGRL